LDLNLDAYITSKDLDPIGCQMFLGAAAKEERGNKFLSALSASPTIYGIGQGRPSPYALRRFWAWEERQTRMFADLGLAIPVAGTPDTTQDDSGLLTFGIAVTLKTDAVHIPIMKRLKNSCGEAESSSVSPCAWAIELYKCTTILGCGAG